MPAPIPVFFVAEGTGLSAEALGNAILRQFPSIRFLRQKIPFVNSVTEAERAVTTINGAASDKPTVLVFSTCAVDEIRELLATARAHVIDLFRTPLEQLEHILRVSPTRAAGSGHGIGDRRTYDARMSAVEYAMAHDDGQSVRNLDLADVILIAPSRCGKTPTTMYLALQHGIHVANYPLVPEDLESGQLPESIRAARDKCFGLLSTPARLSQVRNERRPNSAYAALEQCSYELRRAELLYRAHRIGYINSAAMSVEEMSAVIMQKLALHRAH